jgi:hypothetical protein
MFWYLNRRVALGAEALCLIAAGPVLGSTGFTPTTITNIAIYAGSSGATGAVVSFSPAISGLEGCSYTTGNEAWIDFTSTTEPTGKSLYATLLAASLAGRTVTLEVNGCGPGGVLPSVYQVSLTP